MESDFGIFLLSYNNNRIHGLSHVSSGMAWNDLKWQLVTIEQNELDLTINKSNKLKYEKYNAFTHAHYDMYLAFGCIVCVVLF